MARKSVDQVRQVTSIGAGPIGGGWAAHFLAQGYDVTAYLHDPAEEAALRRTVETAWQCLSQIGLAPGASQSKSDNAH